LQARGARNDRSSGPLCSAGYWFDRRAGWEAGTGALVNMIPVVALLGAFFAIGIVTAAVALRPVAPGEIAPRRRASQIDLSERIENFTLRLALGLGAAVVIGALTFWPMAALWAAIAGFFAPSLLGGGAARRTRLDRTEAIATWSEMLRDTMAGAGGLEQSIIATAAVAPLPIRREVVRLAARLERERLAPSLREFAEEIDQPTGDLVVAALILAADKSPKRLGDLLGRLATSARATVNMQLRIDAGRARVQTAVKVISGFTSGFALLLLVLNHAYLEPYGTFWGQVALAAVGACFGGAFLWLARAFQYQDEERFLRTEGSPQ
jgi:tight adherence protein B